MLELDGVRVAYPNGPAFRFDMEAARGIVTAISGRSGAGKSTLLDCIGGFLVPSGGSIRVDGADIVARPPEARPVASLFQADNLFDHLSVGQNLALARRSLLPHDEMAAALAAVDLAGLADRRASSLSGGQKQRVALARTLLLGRPVLLLDEPFAALDDESRWGVRDLVQRLTAQHNWMTVLVTHQRDDIAAIAGAAYVLEDGALRPA